jgi:50S ribosomal subunit-associated GTPase HflX
LRELEAEKKPRLHVKNKVDLLPAAQRDGLRDDTRTVHVSAVKKIGLTTLLDRIDQFLKEDPVQRVKLSIPQSEGKALALLEAGGRIYSRDYRDGCVELEADVSASLLRKLNAFAEGGFEAVKVDGEPLSRTVLRERR